MNIDNNKLVNIIINTTITFYEDKPKENEYKVEE